ncbi:cytochrome b [Methylocystis sp. S23]
MSDVATMSRYSAPAQAFHWLTVLFVAAAWTLGVLGDELPKGSIRHMGEFLHIIFGQLVLSLLLLRVAWRFATPAPPLELTGFGAFAAKAVHLALYALLIAVPVVGLVTLFHGGEPLPLFGIADIPSPWPKNRELKHYSKEIHELLAHILALLAITHAAAALAHHFLLKDRTLKRMLPPFLAS